MTKLEPGTIIHGTMQPQPIRDTLYDLLFEIDPHRAAKIDIEDGWPEYSQEVIDEITDALNEYAPKGYYVGTHPGDGSDIGVWPKEDDD